MFKKFKKQISIVTGLHERHLYKNISSKYGHYKSVKESSAVDSDGEPIPWYTYPAIEYLDQFDFSNKCVFEWGTGNSTLYWSKRVKEIVSVEDDEEWFDKVSKEIDRRNTEIYLIKEMGEYVNYIAKSNKKFDIIVIDAKFRDQCAKIAPRFLSPGGMIVFDNSDRYPNLLRAMREKNNYIQVDFHGFSPINSYSLTTTILFDRKINLKPINRQPTYSKASLRESCE